MNPNVRRRRRVEPFALFDRLLAGFDIEAVNRLGDLLIAVILLMITLPLIAIVALAIKCESAGQALVRQTCIGRGGRRFQMLRFRTAMYDPEHTTPAWGHQLTQLGQFLRETRIECLPRLINVLRGEIGIINREARSPSFLD